MKLRSWIVTYSMPVPRLPLEVRFGVPDREYRQKIIQAVSQRKAASIASRILFGEIVSVSKFYSKK